MKDGEFKILLVDDSGDDTFFIRRAIEKSGLGKVVAIVENGEEAIEYLRGDGRFSEREQHPFPTVIISDLKMPRMNGFELLRWVKKHPQCAVVPTILFSNSAEASDVKEAYELGANAYMMKPSMSEDLEDLLQLTCRYWTRCEKPPALAKC